MNIGIFPGTIGRDAQVRHTTTNNKAVATFSLATKQRSGETEWVKCEIWGERVEKLAPSLKKGTALTVWGTISSEAWIDRETKGPVSQLKVTIDQITFQGAIGGSKTKSGEETSGESQSQQSYEPDQEESVV